jgi:hypothetical protein
MKRTAAIYILAIIAVIAGIVAVVDTLRYLGWLFSPLNFVESPLYGAIFSAIVAAIWFWAAYMIWKINPQGWLFMVAIAAIYLVIDGFALIAGTPIELLLPSIIISGLALIVGWLPSTKREFGTDQLKD